MAESCYVYAILARETSLPQGLTGFNGAALHVVPSGSLAAATSVLDESELQPTSGNLLRHEEVVESLGLAGPVLPVRFGTILADRSAVARVLAERHSVLSSDLARLGDKLEFGLAVLWDPDRSDDDTSVERPSDEYAESRPSRMGTGARYLMGRLAQNRKEQLVRSRANAIADGLDEVLRPHVLDSRQVVLPTARLALRSAYLLESCQVAGFRRAFEESRHACPHLRLLLSGPWPPYSFVTSSDPLPSILEDIHELTIAQRSRIDEC